METATKPDWKYQQDEKASRKSLHTQRMDNIIINPTIIAGNRQKLTIDHRKQTGDGQKHIGNIIDRRMIKKRTNISTSMAYNIFIASFICALIDPI